MKKRIQNDKRKSQKMATDTEQDADKNAPGADAVEGEWNPEMVEHVRMMTSLIEDRMVSREETLEMLEKVMRQHSISRRERIDYIVQWLKKNSP